MTPKVRACTMAINKRLFCSIAWSKDINYKKTRRGTVERRDDEREKVINDIVSVVTPGQIKDKMKMVMEYLNETAGTIVPVRKIIISDMA